MPLEPQDQVVNFGGVKMPNGYEVVWSSGMEMYYWRRIKDDLWDGPYCDRFAARRSAISHSETPTR